MLQLTPSAATRLEEARQESGLPDTSGVRVSGTQTPDGRLAVQVGFVETPADGDQISDEQDTRLFVAPEVAGPLDGAALDVEDGPEGIQLVLKPQEETGQA